MAEEVEVMSPPWPGRGRPVVAAWVALAFASAAVIVGLVGYRIGSDAIRAGCTFDDFHNTGETLIGIACAVLAPVAFLAGLVATVRRGPTWSRLAGAAVMVVAVGVEVALITHYWDYTCST